MISRLDVSTFIACPGSVIAAIPGIAPLEPRATAVAFGPSFT